MVNSTLTRSVRDPYVNRPINDDTNSDSIPFWPNFFAKLISVLYCILCALAFIQASRTIIHRHKIASFRFGFLSLCFIWTLLRTIFWFFIDLDSSAASIIFFVPNACQIATFSLLVLFYAKLVHRVHWGRLRVRFITFCVLANTAMLLLTITFAALIDRTDKSTKSSDPNAQNNKNVNEFIYKMYFITSAVFFGVLVVLAAYYIYQLHQQQSSQRINHMIMMNHAVAPHMMNESSMSQHTVNTNLSSLGGTTKREVLFSSLIFLIFLSRCVFDLLGAFDEQSGVFRHNIKQTNKTKLLEGPTFGLLFLWEIVPTLMVIVYFRHIPVTADSFCIGAWACCPGCIQSCLFTWPFSFPASYFQPSSSALLADQTDEGTFTPYQYQPSHIAAANAAAMQTSSLTDSEEEADNQEGEHAPPRISISTSVGETNQYSNKRRNSSSLQMNNTTHEGAPVVNNHTGDLYGSPTWSNHAYLLSSSQHQHPHQQINSHPHVHTGYSNAYNEYEDEDADLIHAYPPIHPYQQQQAFLLMQQQQLHHMQQLQLQQAAMYALQDGQRVGTLAQVPESPPPGQSPNTHPNSHLHNQYSQDGDQRQM